MIVNPFEREMKSAFKLSKYGIDSFSEILNKLDSLRKEGYTEEGAIRYLENYYRSIEEESYVGY